MTVKETWDAYQAAVEKYGVGSTEANRAHTAYARALTAARKKRQAAS